VLYSGVISHPNERHPMNTTEVITLDMQIKINQIEDMLGNLEMAKAILNDAVNLVGSLNAETHAQVRAPVFNSIGKAKQYISQIERILKH
jgi:hypothetical protein